MFAMKNGSGTAYHSGAPEFTPVLVRFVLFICVMFCRSLFFLLAVVLFVLLQFTDYYYPFGIFKLFLSWKESYRQQFL